MLTSTVIWPVERTGEKVDREEGGVKKKERAIHNLMTTTNTDVKLCSTSTKQQTSVGLLFASVGLIRLVLFRLQTWPPKRDKGASLGVRVSC